MNEPQKPSKLWSAVGIGIPALTAVFALIAALTTQQRAVYISLAAASVFITVLALQRVYAVFGRRQLTDDSTTQSGNDSNVNN
ncbi:MAG: hypothetical protein H8E66_13420 [Planctomycetes bacterium]|nr:hypothetical protein [Planctomycetota bacterium]